MRTRLSIRGTVFLLLLLALSLPFLSPLGALDVPEDRLLVLTGPSRYEVIQGEVFSINLFLDRTGPEEVMVALPDLPEGIEIESEPVLLSRSDGVVEARIEGIARRPGRFVLNPILVETATGPWFVPRLLLEVAPRRGEKVPFRARWRLLQESVFQGQSVPLILEITGIDSFTFPEGITVRSPQSGLFEETSGIGSVISDSVAGVDLFQIPVAVFLFTATSAGDVVIPAAEVAALGISVTAPPLTIDVGRLPTVVEPTGAVGRFFLDVSLDKTALLPGETAQLEIVLEGSGNFPVLDMPAFTIEGLRVLDQIDGEDFSADTESLLGYHGERRRIVRLEPEEGSDRGTIRVEGYSYYDPTGSRVITTAPRVFEIEIAADAAMIDSGRTRPQYALLTMRELRQLRWYRFIDLQWPLLLFLLGPFVFAAARLYSVRRGKGRRSGVILAGIFLLSSAAIVPLLNMDRLGRAQELVQAGEYATAGVLYDLELQDIPSHAGLHYNRGVLALRSENAYAAVYHLRRASRLAPERRDFQNALNDAVEYFELTDQIALPAALRPDLLILLLLVLWSLFWLLLLARSALWRSISLVSVVMVGVIVLVGVIWSVQVASRPEGIVRRELSVRRIPDESAEPWVLLEPITTVQIELSYNEFYLVRTGSGVTGWVPQNDIRRFGVYW